MIRWLSLLVGILFLSGCSTLNAPPSSPLSTAESSSSLAISLYAQARLAWNDGDAEKTLALSRQALAVDPRSVHALELQAEALLKQGQVSEALQAINRSIEIAPDFRRIS